MNGGFLSNKVILVLSPQAWGDMLLAKHHYAMALAEKGNEVYFLNPPDNFHWNWRKSKKRIRVVPVADHPNLHLINQELFFPYGLKFHSRKLYNFLIKKQIRNILQSIPKQVDLVWSFDLGNLFPLSFFEKKIFKVFHPVDEPGDKNAILAASGANVIFSVTKEIIEKYKNYKIPSWFINHGLADEFILNDALSSDPYKGVHVGLSGNFLRPDLDRNILLQIIRGNPEILFHFYGSYIGRDSNIGAAGDRETKIFIDQLLGFRNVKMHGVLKTAELAQALNQMNALLICYDIHLDQSKGTNYHKVMEYLSTGKVIISNNITTYQEYPDLIRMIANRENNELLPDLFKETIDNLGKWNATELELQRKAFAKNNSYQMQLNRIEQHMIDVWRKGIVEKNNILTLEA